MKYLMMVKLDPHTDEGRRYETGNPPDPRLMAAMGKHAEEMAKAGILLGTGGLLPSSKGARVRAADGRLSVTDGPFVESKEYVAGIDIIEVADLDEAIALASRHPAALGGGSVEVRPVWE